MSRAGKSKSIRFGTTTNAAVGFTKGRSSRNTAWNGVDMTSGKWKGHVASSTDSITSAGIGEFDIQGRGFQEVQDLLAKAGGAFTQMAQDAIAKGAAEGRKRATRIEEGIFRFGKVWTHSAYPGAHAPAGMWKSASRFDPALGGYRGVGSSGNALRLINFNFKYGHTYGYLGDLPGTIEARVTSQMANLFENDAVWRKNSPFWNIGGGPWMRYSKNGKRNSRQGRHYFTQLYQAFDQGLLDGVQKAEKAFNDRIQANAAKDAKKTKAAAKKVVI